MNHPSSPAGRLLVALDTADRAVAEQLMREVAPYVGGFKIGKTLFTAAGPPVVAAALATGARVFLDLKFHDIPHTVAGAVAAVMQLGVHLCTVHTLGGRAMLQAAVEPLAALPPGSRRPTILGVTLLTSADQATLDEIGLAGTPEEVVLRLARLAVDCGLRGVFAPGSRGSAASRAQGFRHCDAGHPSAGCHPGRPAAGADAPRGVGGRGYLPCGGASDYGGD